MRPRGRYGMSAKANNRGLERIAHQIAGAMHTALACRGASVRDLSLKIHESEAFIWRALQADHGTARALKVEFLANVAWALDCDVALSLVPRTPDSPEGSDIKWRDAAVSLGAALVSLSPFVAD